MKTYYVYILECNDRSYYTGITNNLEIRINEHNSGDDPKSYTYNKRPTKLVFFEEFSNPVNAISKEKQIKGWNRAKKKSLIDNNWDELIKLSNFKNNKR